MRVLVLAMLSACAVPTFHSTYDQAPSAAELAGTWQAHYAGKVFIDDQHNQFRSNAVETLRLNADGTYQQVFDDQAGYLYRSQVDTFRVTREEDGKVFVFLKSMRYYPSGIRAAEAGSGRPEEWLQLEGPLDRALLCFADDDLGLCFARASKS